MIHIFVPSTFSNEVLFFIVFVGSLRAFFTRNSQGLLSMVAKKADVRIRTLIENGVKTKHRSMIVIIGDKYHDRIVDLHDWLSKSVVKSRPTVLWCYKDKLEFSSNKEKREGEIKKRVQKGTLSPKQAAAISLFRETTGITYCQYRDSERVRGNTFGMCILQDFEALTPNLIARTIVTVEGGGVVIVLIRSLSSLTSLCTMVMDVHERFRTESHTQATGRFNERFLLSLGSCKACGVVDDEFNILPISSHMKSIAPVPFIVDSEGISESDKNLRSLQKNLNDFFPAGPLLKKCRTSDQGKAVITFLDAILDETHGSTVALLAAHGRGKSAALGLAIAGAIAAGYYKVFVTAPGPENLKTLFEFVRIGFGILEYKEHLDYDVVKSTNPGFKKAIVGININKQRRQTIQYIQPHEHEKLSQAELLVVDEAAAIPLPVVKSLLGPRLVFLSSTVNGYEGTGRSLFLELLQQLEEQSRRLFKKIELNESIRYASGDPIESWLNGLLCLDVTSCILNISDSPPPSECDLYYVNRDTLFSYHKDSELFLQRMMALFVASHYTNSPNDLQLMADAPAHHLFVLLGPVDESKNDLPDILCVVQVCFEGQISRNSAMKSLGTGRLPHGDQIPWKFYEQFGNPVFSSLSGARIVRIATHPTHPTAMGVGYGSTAVELLSRYFEGHMSPISEEEVENVVESPPVGVLEAAEKVTLLKESIKPRSELPPLLIHLCERKPEKLHYMGVSFGLTLELLCFWRNNGFVPFFIGEIPSTVTGEHTCMVLKPLKNASIENIQEWGHHFQKFRNEFRVCLGPSFKTMECELAMKVLDPKIKFKKSEPAAITSNEFSNWSRGIFDLFSMNRLEAYSNSPVDNQMIRLHLPILSHLYFYEKLRVDLIEFQAKILICMGLQGQDITYVERAMNKQRSEILTHLIQAMKRLYKYLDNISSNEDGLTLARPRKEIKLHPHPISVDVDLNDAANKVKNDAVNKRKTEAGMLNPELLGHFAIEGKEAHFEKALTGKISGSGIISVQSTADKSNEFKCSDKKNKKRGKESERGGSSTKKRKK